MPALPVSCWLPALTCTGARAAAAGAGAAPAGAGAAASAADGLLAAAGAGGALAGGAGLHAASVSAATSQILSDAHGWLTAAASSPRRHDGTTEDRIPGMSLWLTPGIVRNSQG